MRKIVLAVVLLIMTASSSALAQDKAEITGMAGYAFGGRLDVLTGRLKVEDSEVFGAILGFNVARGSQVELSWTYQPTNLKFTPFVGLGDKIGLDVHYFQIGGVREFPSGQARPFARFTLGATYYNPEATPLNGVNVSSEWRFSFTFGLGAKYFFSPRVGLRLQGDLVGTFLNSSGGVFCGFGGCSLGLFGSGIFSGDVMAGLSIAI